MDWWTDWEEKEWNKDGFREQRRVLNIVSEEIGNSCSKVAWNWKIEL
jgi:hypothetical protein